MGGSEALNGVPLASNVPLGILEILTSVLFSVASIEKSLKVQLYWNYSTWLQL